MMVAHLKLGAAAARVISESSDVIVKHFSENRDNVGDVVESPVYHR